MDDFREHGGGTGGSEPTVWAAFCYDAMGLLTEVIREKAHSIIRAAGRRGHVFNLGHGITPSTPISGVQAMVDAVTSWSWDG